MARRKVEQLKALLDSDDELPNDYCEDPDMPAYQDDNRFNSQFNFGWVKKSYEPSLKDVSVSITSEHESCRVDTNREKCYNTPFRNSFVSKGVLLHTDVYCLSQIASNTSEELLLWFCDFLFHRDMQSDYTFLNSCLIDYNFPDFTNINKYDTSFIEKKEKFEVVVV